MPQGNNPDSIPEIRVEYAGELNDRVGIAVKEVIVDTRVLPRPEFHLFQDYDHGYRFNIFGNGFAFGTSGRRGCIRTEVSNRSHASVKINLFGVRGGIHSTIANDFQAPARSKKTSVSLTAFGHAIDSTRNTEENQGGFHKRVETSVSTKFGLPGGQELGRLKAERVRHVPTENVSSSQRWKVSFERAPYSTSNGSGAPVNPGISMTKSTSQDESSSHNQASITDLDRDLEGQPTKTELPIHKPAQIPEEPAKKQPNYIVIGLFSSITGAPKERLVLVKEPKTLFRHMWWAIIRLRGFGALLSLKDVKSFAVYQVRIEDYCLIPTAFDQQSL